jgi:capsular exopolysaccharide synthesis family protein
MLQRNSLVSNSSEENPLVQDLDKKLSEMRGAIVSSIDNQVNTLNTQIRGLRAIEGASTSRLSSNPKQANYLLSVERQQKVKESLYLFLLQKREENELSQAFTAYNTRVISSPSGSMAPTAPPRRIILLLAGLIGVLIPVIVIFLREVTNTKVRGRKDIEHLTVPFIGEIPQYGGHKKNRHKDAGYELLVKPRSRNVINEAFRIVRTNLEFVIGGDHSQRVVMITSANQTSGKTFLTANIASSFAVKEKRVVAIDMDLRRASLSQYVGKPAQGISDFLNGSVTDWHSIVVPVEGQDNLNIIPVGTIPPNPAELLFSPRLQQLLDELRAAYDLVFLDCPPVEVVADASIIAKWADVTVFVVRAGNIEREMLPIVEGYYVDKKFNNMTMLLNGTTATGRYGYHRYGYSYGYGHYGGYTKEE